MKISLGKIYGIQKGLQEALKKNFSIRISYLLVKNVKRIKGHLENIDAIRLKLVDKYKDEKGQKVATDKFGEFAKEFNDFLNEKKNEVDVKFITVKIAEFEKEKETLSGELLIALEDIIVE